MKFLLDTANIDEILKWKNFITGVTTNPLHLENEGATWEEWLDEFSKVHSFEMLSKNWDIFIQINEDPNIQDFTKFDFNIIWKVSMNQPLFNLAKNLKDKEYSVCATTVYDLAQLNFALENSFDYSMVYYHKNEDKEFLYDALAYRERFHIDKDTKLVAASFRTKNEIIEAMRMGIEYATVRPEHMELLYTNRQAREDYQELYG